MTKRARRSRPEIGPLVGDLRSFSGSLALVITLGEFLGHLAVERRNVVRLTARHEAHEVRVRLRTTFASTRSHGPWHIAAIGLPALNICRTNRTARSSCRS